MTQEGMPLWHVCKCEKVGDVIRKIPRKNCRFAAFGMGIGYAGKGSMGFVSRHCRMGAVMYKSDGMAKLGLFLENFSNSNEGELFIADGYRGEKMINSL